MAETINKRLEDLREVMRREHLAACIFPSTDPHQSEYVADHWKGREWISGFNGSAGTAVVTLTSAALWTDSRYFLYTYDCRVAGAGTQGIRGGHRRQMQFCEWGEGSDCRPSQAGRYYAADELRPAETDLEGPSCDTRESCGNLSDGICGGELS